MIENCNGFIRKYIIYFMQNLTLISLDLLSLSTISTFYLITQRDFKKTSFILNSFFSNSFSTIIYSYNQRHSSLIHSNSFSHILNTPIVFTRNILNKTILDDPNWNEYNEGILCFDKSKKSVMLSYT